MKAFLMYRDRDFDPEQILARRHQRNTAEELGLQRLLPWNAEVLTQDLELDTLIDAMAGGDQFLSEASRSAIVSAVRQDLDTIAYRQAILADCLKNAAIIRDMYALTIDAIEREKKKFWSWFGDSPAATLNRAVGVMGMLVEILRRLREMADLHDDKFASDGFRRLLAMLRAELSDDYFAEVQAHLRELKFRDGVLASAELGEAAKGNNYTLRRLQPRDRSWLKRIFTQPPPSFTLHLSPRDEAGGRALSELHDRGIALVANALAQSCDHVLRFLAMLRTELAFYVGCLNLHGHLAKLDEPVCFPVAAAPGERRFSCRELYDICLALRMGVKVVGNDVNADGKDLMVITGANQGGKSTFLRSVGLAQLMMQAGMFAPAESFSASVCEGVFTHYKREEDVTMKSGKLDEELARMSEIVDNLRGDALVLFNESFAATNEREGSEIARRIVEALVEKRVRAFFVTHLFEFAYGIYETGERNVRFLRAKREADGRRTFKLIEGEPLQTSYGEDLYNRIFAPRRQGARSLADQVAG